MSIYPNKVLTSQKLGRPNKTIITKLKTIVWFNAISIVSGLDTPYKIAKALIVHSDPQEYHFRRIFKNFQNWKKGKNSPSIKWVKKLDEVLPNSARWFNHPLWLILEKPDSIIAANDINDLLRQLPNAYSILFEKILHPVLGRIEKRIRVARPIDDWRCEYFSYLNSDIDYSKHHGLCLDNLAALLILVHEAKILEVKGSRASQIFALNTLNESIPVILKIPVLQGIASELVEHLKHSDDWQYPAPEEKSWDEEFRRAIYLALGLDTEPSYHWTDDSIALLGKMPDEKLAKKLGILTTMVCFMRELHGKAKSN